MSVLIKGMKMPQDCFECDLLNPFVEEPYCRRLLKRCPKTSRLEDCPLIEVPTPHGRLIDADIPEDVRQVHGFFNDYDLQELLEAAPTVIEAEE